MKPVKAYAIMEGRTLRAIYKTKKQTGSWLGVRGVRIVKVIITEDKKT